MNALNNRRVALKHKGIIPAKGEIEASRVNTTDFFTDNTKPIFGFEFSEVSLYELIQFPQAKKLLIEADQFLQKQDFDNCIDNVTQSFYELLREYKETKDFYGGERTHFDFAEDTTFNNRFIDRELNPEVADRLTGTFDKINQNFQRIEQPLAMVSLGIDYRKYTKFKILTPVCTRLGNGDYFLEVVGQKIWNRENCQFLIDFVLECVLRLQDFDFNNQDLIGSDSFTLTITP